jgi:lipid-A-disaccharide synthase
LGLPLDVPVLALLPGSRLGEIKRLLPTFLKAAQMLGSRMPGLVVLIPAANDACREAIERGLAETTLTDVRLLSGQAHQAMIASDVVLLASGTAALEAMLAKRPMVVGYRISALTHRLVMALGLMNINRYSLPNVLANEPIVPELMQGDCTPENQLEALLPFFNDAQARATLQPRYQAIHERLRGDTPDAAARAIAQLLEQPR